MTEIGDLLALNRREVDGSWAFYANLYTQRIHLGVWSSNPPRDYVSKEIIPEFREVRRKLLKLSRSNIGHKKTIETYARSVARRIKNLDNYANGRGSDFVSKSELRRAGCQDYKPR